MITITAYYLPSNHLIIGEAAVTSVLPIYLEIHKDPDGFSLCFHDEILLTAEGSCPITHISESLLDHMVNEFEGQGTIEIESRVITAPKFLGAYAYFSIQKEYVETGKEGISEHFPQFLLSDPVLRMSAGPEAVDQLARYEPINRWLGKHFSELQGLGLEYWVELCDEDEPNDFCSSSKVLQNESVKCLQSQYLELKPEKKAAVTMLNAVHQGPLLFPLALVSGRCSVAEYAKGVMASHAILTGVFADTDDEAHRDMFKNLRGDAISAIEYVEFYREGTPHQQLVELVMHGESDVQEFKSTLRVNLHTNNNDNAITLACLKTIAAFLNTKGGKLLIGVADNGDVVGIERDCFSNQDKFLLHLWNSIKSSLGETSSEFITTELLETDSGTVCLVVCEPSPRPIFCKTKGGAEDFFIRTGPATASLLPSQMASYLKEHFP